MRTWHSSCDGSPYGNWSGQARLLRNQLVARMAAAGLGRDEPGDGVLPSRLRQRRNGALASAGVDGVSKSAVGPAKTFGAHDCRRREALANARPRMARHAVQARAHIPAAGRQIAADSDSVSTRRGHRTWILQRSPADGTSCAAIGTGGQGMLRPTMRGRCHLPAAPHAGSDALGRSLQWTSCGFACSGGVPTLGAR